MVLADSVSGVDVLSTSWTAFSSLCPHMAEGARELSGRTLIPFMKAPPPSHRELGFNIEF